MLTLRKRKTSDELSATPVPKSVDDYAEIPIISLYEQSREERIRENKERLQKLGIVDLSEKLRSSIPPKRTPRRKFGNLSAEKPAKLLLLREPTRRSSRLKNVTPASYSELPLKENDLNSKKRLTVLEEGAKPEIYTEEHEKLLGNTERIWELFVDGCGKDGKRIYDSFRGKTCHQCRQKTLGHRTQCCKCNMVQGQFCGDCLYMRYGEHVLEALENPAWVCPVCRGICNCSLCRQAKGWHPTGMLYKKVANLGYKSVAHYLIQTHCVQNNVEEQEEKTLDTDSVGHTSVKRSLPFSDPETVDKQVDESNRDDLKFKKVEKPAKRSLPFSYKEAEEEESNIRLVELKPENNEALIKNNDRNAKSKRSMAEPSPDSIGARLRHRRMIQNVQSKCLELTIFSTNEEEDKNVQSKCLGLTLFSSKEEEDKNSVVGLEPKKEACSKDDTNSDAKPKRSGKSRDEFSPDSIGARLRQRRKILNEKSSEVSSPVRCLELMTV